MYRGIRYDEGTKIIRLLTDTDTIEIPYGTILMVRHIYRVDPNKLVSSIKEGKRYSFVGRIVVRESDSYIGFDVLSAEEDSSMYKFSIGISLRDLVECREFKLTDIPRIINWSWIGEEINYRYFKKGNVL